ncbi:hypothetical protein J8273_2373 [Carpediemonas membranifera]|uniref:TmcB/TmcC TPR repeats domain-containing protein n=1 Tax=Carpediemonas membranifera TaxID=201153 RepID=A0A8J6E185_9EUKA|nr:hypothetical protein J8273_2373 [Carpediemonas membranifera]|eukprot:KAG9396024.1 hypothetical protein J8273_2373 [Carpediemonas membranifera]
MGKETVRSASVADSRASTSRRIGFLSPLKLTSIQERIPAICGSIRLSTGDYTPLLVLSILIQAFQLSSLAVAFNDSIFFTITRVLLPSIFGLFADNTAAQVIVVVAAICVLGLMVWLACEAVVVRTIRQGLHYRLLAYAMLLVSSVLLVPLIQALSLPLFIAQDDGTNDDVSGILSAVDALSVTHLAYFAASTAALVILAAMAMVSSIVFFSGPYSDSSILTVLVPSAAVFVQPALTVILGVVAATRCFGLDSLNLYASAGSVSIVAAVFAAYAYVCPIHAHPSMYLLNVGSYLNVAVVSLATVYHPGMFWLSPAVTLMLVVVLGGLRYAFIYIRLNPALKTARDPLASAVDMDEFGLDADPRLPRISRTSFTQFVWLVVIRYQLFNAQLRRQSDRREMLAAAMQQDDLASRQREMIGRLQSLVSFACAEKYTSGRARLTVVQYSLTVAANYEAAIFEAARVPAMVERDIIKHLGISTIMMLVGLHTDADRIRRKQDSGLNAEALADLNHKQKKAKEESVNARRAINSFWRALDQGKPDVNELLAISQEIHKHSTSADKLYIQLIKAFPERDNIIRAYAQFVTVVQQDPEYGAQIDLCAEEIANQRLMSDVSSSASSSRSGSQVSAGTRTYENDILTVLRTHTSTATSSSVANLRKAVLALIAIITAIFVIVGTVFQVRMFVMSALVDALSASGTMSYSTSQATFLALLSYLEQTHPGKFTRGVLESEGIIKSQLELSIDELVDSSHSLDDAVSSIVTSTLFPDIFSHAREPSFLARYYLDTTPATTESVDVSIVSMVASLGVAFRRIVDEAELDVDVAFIQTNGLESLRNGIDILQEKIVESTETAEYIGAAVDIVAVLLVVGVLFGLQFFLLRRAFNNVTLHQAENINVFLHIDRAIVQDMIKTTNVAKKERRKKRKSANTKRAITFEPRIEADDDEEDDARQSDQDDNDVNLQSIHSIHEDDNEEGPVSDTEGDDAFKEGEIEDVNVINDSFEQLELGESPRRLRHGREPSEPNIRDLLRKGARGNVPDMNIAPLDDSFSASASDAGGQSETVSESDSGFDLEEAEYRLERTKRAHARYLSMARAIFWSAVTMLGATVVIVTATALTVAFDFFVIPTLRSSFSSVGEVEEIIVALVDECNMKAFKAIEFLQLGGIAPFDYYWRMADTRAVEHCIEALAEFDLSEEISNRLGAVWDSMDLASYREKVELAMVWANTSFNDAVGCQIRDFSYNYSDETWVEAEQAQFGDERASYGFYTDLAADSVDTAAIIELARGVATDTMYWDTHDGIIDELKAVQADLATSIESDGDSAKYIIDLAIGARFVGIALAVLLGSLTALCTSAMIVMKIRLKALADQIDNIRHIVIGDDSSPMRTLRLSVLAAHGLTVGSCIAFGFVALTVTGYAGYLYFTEVDGMSAALSDRIDTATELFDFKDAVNVFMHTMIEYTQRPDPGYLTTLETAYESLPEAVLALDEAMSSYDVSEETVTGLRGTVETLNHTLLIAATLAIWANDVPATVAAPLHDLEYDITTETGFEYDRMHYTREHCYTDTAHDKALDADEQLTIAREILFDEKFSELVVEFKAYLAEYQTEVTAIIDERIDAHEAREMILLGITAALLALLLVFLALIGVLLMALAPTKARKLSVIKQRVTARATQRFYRIAATTVALIGCIFVGLTAYSELWILVGSNIDVLNTAAARSVRLIDAVAEAMFTATTQQRSTEHYNAAVGNLDVMVSTHESLTGETSLFLSAMGFFQSSASDLSNSVSCTSCAMLTSQSYEQALTMLQAAVPELNPALGKGTCLARDGTGSIALITALEVVQQLAPVFHETFDDYCGIISTVLLAYRLINVPLYLFAIGFLLLSYRLVFRRIFIALSRDESIVLSLLVMIPKEHVANNAMLATFIAEHAIDN